MKLFDVYPLFDITPVKASGCWVWDDNNKKYLDLYGGHAVISIGHTHPHYVKRIEEQLERIGFYSNSIQNPLQEELAQKLGRLSGCENYQLFLCSSGAEANENALKVASFVTGRKKILAFRNAFHGRTSGAVAATDNPAIVSPFNAVHEVVFANWNDINDAAAQLNDQFAAVIIEGIQGVGGIQVADDEFLRQLETLCRKHGAMLILDEVQCGYGRTGKFFSHQYAGIKPDLITMAKGMGNGFPVGGVLIRDSVEAKHGMLGTTFGGSHLACAAALAVVEVIQEESLIDNALETGTYLMNALKSIPGITEVRGRGLMIGIDLPKEYSNVRKELLFDHNIFTGVSKPNVVRLLPPLSLSKDEADRFLEAFQSVMKVNAL